MSINQLISHTNQKLANWYNNAMIDYNVEGTASASIQGDEFIIIYTENGITKKWSTYFHGSYLSELSNDFFYDAWSELSSWNNQPPTK